MRPLPRRSIDRPRDVAGRLRTLAAGLLLSLALSVLPASAQAGFEDEDVCARAQDSALSWKELDPLLLARHAMSKDGRDVLRHLARSRLLGLLERERGVRVDPAQVQAREREIEAQARASGDPSGLAGYLKKARLGGEEFRDFLRLSFVQETLTRRALGLPDTAPVNADQQEIWIDEELAARGFVELPPPWKDGVVARATGVEITEGELVRTLRRRLPSEAVENDCYQFLLARRMRARMPDLGPEKLDQYVRAEIERRRTETNADPRYKGIPYEQLLASQGLAFDALPADPAVQVAALARAWIDRAWPEEAKKKVYASEREYFDGLYGAALDTSMLFLRAAQFKNDLNPRTFAEAQAKLAEVGARCTSKGEFQKLASELSEDAASRERKGALGWLTTETPKLPPEIRAELERRLAKGGPGAEKQLAGPLRLSNGCVLLWFDALRPTPGWETMSREVDRELRKRFIEEALPRASLVTAFDAE
jgi:hypothetical protein